MPHCYCLYYFRMFFFFQAEYCIRDFHVTGVQTCALPICPQTPPPSRRCSATWASTRRARASGRSEERRVGKECRSRWSAYHEKKKKRRGRGTWGTVMKIRMTFGLFRG